MCIHVCVCVYAYVRPRMKAFDNCRSHEYGERWCYPKCVWVSRIFTAVRTCEQSIYIKPHIKRIFIGLVLVVIVVIVSGAVATMMPSIILLAFP